VDSLLKAIQSTADVFSAWLVCIAHPYATCEKFSGDNLDDNQKIKGALQIWGTAFAVAVVLQLPIYKLFGIGLQDVHFHLPAILFVLVTLFLGAYFAHMALRLHKIASRFPDTLAIYAISVGAFAPFFTVLSYPSTLKNFYTVQAIKHGGLDAAHALAVLVKKSAPTDSLLDFAVAVSSPLGGVIGLLCLALFANAICMHYRAEKHAVISAVGLAVAILLPATAVISLIATGILYVAIS